MKNYIKYALAFLAMVSSSVYAQKASIDSPHNYKRPVFQQRKALVESNSVKIMSQSESQIRNNISSVHNYKRQGSVNFASEASLVVSMPKLETSSMNPLIASGNYKSHFTTTEYGRQLAAAKKRTDGIQTATIIIKSDSTIN